MALWNFMNTLTGLLPEIGRPRVPSYERYFHSQYHGLIHQGYWWTAVMILDRSKSGSNEIDVLANVDPGSTLTFSIGPGCQQRLDCVLITSSLKTSQNSRRQLANRIRIKFGHLTYLTWLIDLLNLKFSWKCIICDDVELPWLCVWVYISFIQCNF